MYLSTLVRDRAAIVLEPGKEYLALTRLDPVARKAGLGSVTELVAHLRRGESTLHEEVVDALTTNETSWFRDQHPWDSLRLTILPELIEQKRNSRTLQIWCAGCSTGQEPYSLAMLLQEHFPELATWNISIVGTDISQAVLDRARAGRYGQLEVNRGLPAHMLVRHFEREGMEWVIEDPIRTRVRFQRHNLVGPWPAFPPFDLIMMRNVMIYFDLETKRTLLARVRDALAPGGLLLLGGSESTFNIDETYGRRLDHKTAWYYPNTDPIGGAGR
jgi:chemotaxis protein methyltransferase CheR